MKTSSFLLAIVSLAATLQGAVYEPINAFRLGPGLPGSGTLVRHTDGNDYGTTAKNGPKGEGTIYRVTPAGAVELISTMDFNANPEPSGGLTADGAGFLWGVARGVFDAGSIYKFDPATGTRTTVATFPSDGSKGGGPVAELFNDGAGFMWGTAAFGGTNNNGTIYEVEIATGTLTKVTAFTGTSGVAKGTRPQAKLVPEGTTFLWGTTQFGGAGGFGTIFKVEKATGTVSTLAEFTGDPGTLVPGKNPTAPLVNDGLGFFWGTTPSGSSFFSTDAGTVFKVNATTGAFTSVFAFTGATGAHRGAGSPAALVLESTGMLLGVSPSTFDSSTFALTPGTIYRINAATGGQTTVLDFTGRSGAAPGTDPFSALVPISAGIFRGTTNLGGTADKGTVYQFNAVAGTVTTVANLLGTEPPPTGAQPAGKLVSDGLGFLWGVTEFSGLNGEGTIFKMDVATGQITTVVDLTGDSGSALGSGPTAELILQGGLLWGVTPRGGTGGGTIFKIDPANGTFTSVAQLSNSGTGPNTPSGALLADGAGFLWGCASDGGAHSQGAIYKVEMANGAVSIVVSFAQDHDSAPTATPLGAQPSGALARDDAGNFWGTTEYGGIYGVDRFGDPDMGSGTVFKIDPATGALTTVVKFTGTAGAVKGKQPNGSLVRDGAGGFLGTTGSGAVFKVTIASGAYKALATISGGLNPGLTSDGAGKFWGTTREGGTGFIGLGTVFNMTAAGVVQTFLQVSDTEAQNPSGGLLLHAGDLYGVTAKGGVATSGAFTGGGQIYRIVLNEPPVPAQVVAVKGGGVPGETSTTYSALGVPEPGPFAGSMKAGTKTVAAIFAGDGTVRARVGGAVTGLPNALFAKLGAPSGDAATAALTPSAAANVTTKNDAVLLTGLIAGPVKIAVREGVDFGPVLGLSVKTFGTIDGAPAATGATFFLATLQGTGVTTKNDSALLAVLADGSVKVLAREGDMVNGKPISIISTLVGIKGALGEGRWRADGASFGVRLTFSDPAKSQAIFTIPASATSPAQWTRWLGLGDTLGAPLAGVQISALGFPAFGSDGPAVLATLKPGTGTPAVTAKNDSAIVRVDAVGLVVLAREGGTPPGLGGTVAFKTFSDPVSGAHGRTAFAATISVVTAPFSKGLWYSADGETLTELARTGRSAPHGGKFAAFSSLALPDGAASGPIFTATLTVDKAADISAANNSGLWAVNSSGVLKLVLRTGQKVVVNAAPLTIKSFTALVPAPGSIGAAHGYDNAGHLAVLATFTDKTVALLEFTVP